MLKSAEKFHISAHMMPDDSLIAVSISGVSCVSLTPHTAVPRSLHEPIACLPIAGGLHGSRLCKQQLMYSVCVHVSFSHGMTFDMKGYLSC